MAAQPTATDSNTGNDSDQDFDPTAEMLVNDFDDEHTLEEEEAIDDGTNVSDEINDLQKEGEMPLEELLSMYGYEQSNTGHASSSTPAPLTPESCNTASTSEVTNKTSSPVNATTTATKDNRIELANCPSEKSDSTNEKNCDSNSAHSSSFMDSSAVNPSHSSQLSSTLSTTTAATTTTPSIAAATTTGTPASTTITLINNSRQQQQSADAAVPHWTLPQSSTSSFNSCIPSGWQLFDRISDITKLRIIDGQVYEISDEEENGSEDDNSECDDNWRRTIQVGSDYQACISEGLSNYGDVPPYENEDKLLWDPFVLPQEKIDSYLRQIAHDDVLESLEPNNPNSNPVDIGPVILGTEDILSKKQDTSITSTAATINSSSLSERSLPDSSLVDINMSNNMDSSDLVRDDETALFTLHQCGYNIEEALRRRKMQQCSTLYEPMTSWSEEECSNFEEGFRIFGKDFHQIQKNKIPTRSVGELVQFYYLWKKTERHDMYVSKWRIEKKKYSLHPGTTDYMDRFLTEQETLALQAGPVLSSSFCNSSYGRQQSHGSFSLIPNNHICSGVHSLLNPSAKESILDDVLVSSVSCVNKSNGLIDKVGPRCIDISSITEENIVRPDDAHMNEAVNLKSGTRENESISNISSSKVPSSNYFSFSNNSPQSTSVHTVQHRTNANTSSPIDSNS